MFDLRETGDSLTGKGGGGGEGRGVMFFSIFPAQSPKRNLGDSSGEKIGLEGREESCLSS